MVESLFADDTIVLADCEEKLQKVVLKFHMECVRKKLRVNAGKSKVMTLERKEVEALDFNTTYRDNVSVAESCDIVVLGERMEVVKEFNDLTPSLW